VGRGRFKNICVFFQAAACDKGLSASLKAVPADDLRCESGRFSLTFNTLYHLASCEVSGVAGGLGTNRMDQTELRYQAVQCHVRAQRTTNEDDAEWLLGLAAKLARMADAQDGRSVFFACRDFARAD